MLTSSACIYAKKRTGGGTNVGSGLGSDDDLKRGGGQPCATGC
jgi:hypothetical protein